MCRAPFSGRMLLGQNHSGHLQFLLCLLRGFLLISLRWRHNEWDGVSNHQPQDCLLNRLSGCRSKKISKLRVTGLCAGNSPGTGEFPAQMASNAENVSIWWRHHVSLVHDVAPCLSDRPLSAGGAAAIRSLDPLVRHRTTKHVMNLS